MSQLADIFGFVATCIQGYLNVMLSNWLSSCIIFLLVLNVVVTTVLVIRGSKSG